jgi:hypothetical protein
VPVQNPTIFKSGTSGTSGKVAVQRVGSVALNGVEATVAIARITNLIISSNLRVICRNNGGCFYRPSDLLSIQANGLTKFCCFVCQAKAW